MAQPENMTVNRRKWFQSFEIWRSDQFTDVERAHAISRMIVSRNAYIAERRRWMADYTVAENARLREVIKKAIDDLEDMPTAKAVVDQLRSALVPALIPSSLD